MLIEPKRSDDFDKTLAALEAQIQAASSLKTKWKPRFAEISITIFSIAIFIHKSRTYSLVSGYLRVYLGDSDPMVHELDIDLSVAVVERVALPNKPHCISIKPSTVCIINVCSILY